MLTHRIVFAAMLFTVAACATAISPEAEQARAEARAAEVFEGDPRRGELVDRVCFAAQIDSFGKTTDRAVVIREGRDHYLVETFGGCFDLDHAQSLAFRTTTSCLTKGDRIFASDSAFGFGRHRAGPQSCLIKAIYDWDRDAKADDEAESDTEDDAETDIEEVETADLN